MAAPAAAAAWRQWCQALGSGSCLGASTSQRRTRRNGGGGGNVDGGRFAKLAARGSDEAWSRQTMIWSLQRRVSSSTQTGDPDADGGGVLWKLPGPFRSRHYKCPGHNSLLVRPSEVRPSLSRPAKSPDGVSHNLSNIGPPRQFWQNLLIQPFQFISLRIL